jgi:hypothetical protein
MVTAGPAWAAMLGGTALFLGAVYWVTPPYRRRRTLTRRLLPAFGAFLVYSATVGRGPEQLVLAGGGLAVGALPLLWMGKLPADMPSARDRTIGRHPGYLRIARRGRIAGVAIVVLEIAWIATFVALS